METRASHVLVGVFVLGLIAAAVGFILWLGASSASTSDSLTYRIKFGGDVTGLEVGAKVRFRGIPVGSVTGIQLDPDDTEKIVVRVNVRKGTPIRTDTKASIESQGLTGAPFIQLKGPESRAGDKPKDLLVPVAGQAPPVIEGKPTGLAQILEEFPKAVKAVTDLTNEVRKLVDERNLEEVSKILASARRAMNNLEAASREARPIMVSVGKVVTKVDAAVDDARKLIASVNTAVGKVDKVLDDVRGFSGTVNKVAGKVDKLVNGVLRVVASAEKVADKSQTAVQEIGKGAKAFAALSWEFRALVRQNRRPISDFAATGLYEFSLFLTDMRKFVRTVNRFIKKMENDPAGFFFGNRQKGFTTRGRR